MNRMMMRAGLAALAIAVVACGGSKSASDKVPADQIAAKVNGTVIQVDEVTKVAGNFAKRGIQPDATAKGEAPAEKLYYTALDRLIEQALVVDDATKRGITVSDENLQASISQLKVMSGGDEAFQNILAQNSITMADVERDMRTNLIIKAYMDSLMSATDSINEDDLQAYYDGHQDEFGPHREVHARHILIRMEPDADQMTQATVKAKAEAVLAEARKGGDFKALATKDSEDETNAQNGGDLGWFGPGRMVASFDSAAFALKPGEVSGLVQTQFGYHIIKVEEDRMSEGQTFDQVKDSIRNMVSQSQTQDVFKKAVAGLRSKAQVEINPPSQETLTAIES